MVNENRSLFLILLFGFVVISTFSEVDRAKTEAIYASRDEDLNNDHEYLKMLARISNEIKMFKRFIVEKPHLSKILYKCILCNEKFNIYSSIIKHLETNHKKLILNSTTPYCTRCRLELNADKDCDRSAATKNAAKVKCKNCKKELSSIWSLRRHLSNVHSEN